MKAKEEEGDDGKRLGGATGEEEDREGKKQLRQRMGKMTRRGRGTEERMKKLKEGAQRRG